MAGVGRGVGRWAVPGILLTGVVALGAVAVWPTSGSPEPGGTVPLPLASGTEPVAVTPSATPSVPVPVLPESARVPTSDGATAFVTYFWKVVDYSYRARTSAALRVISRDSCKFCRQVIVEIDQRRAEDARFEGYGVKVLTAVTPGGDPRVGLITSTMLSLSSGRTVAADGSVIKEFGANPHLGSDVGVIWEGEAWKVVGVVLSPASTS